MVWHLVILLSYHNQNVPLVEFMYLVFTRMPGETYRVGDSGLCRVCVTHFFG